jgi:type II secretory pathway component GspD/PulD (secretin)
VKATLLKEQLDNFDQLRDAPNDPPQASTGAPAADVPAAAPPASQPPPPEPSAPPSPSDMVMIDVVMIRTENSETTSKGVNLFQGLSLQFGGTGSFDQKQTITAAAGAAPAPGQVITRELLGTFTVPTVTYSMNIFNTAGAHNEIIARPTLIATNGKKSEFFSGDSLDVALQGTQSATSHTIDAGVSMSVTPTMQPDGRVAIELAASRSFFETTPGGTFAQAVATSKNTVNVNVVMNFDQTLVLNGLREKQTTQNKTGVPFLREIPFIQYLFSNATTLDFHKSIIILLTPRHVETGVDASDATLTHEQRVGTELAEFRKAYADLFKYDVGISHPLGHLMGHKVWLGLTKSHTFDTKWYGAPDSLKTMIQRNLSFLYY